MKLDTAFILCAGFGKRVRPLTNQIPKPLLEINNLTLLERCIHLIEKLGIHKIYLNVFHLKKEIKKFIEDHNYNSEIFIIDEGEEILDTGGGILNLLEKSNSNDFFVFNPDTVWSIDYLAELKKMENLYFEKKLSNILLLVNKNLSFDETLDGDFKLQNNLIYNENKNDYIFTGCQILNKSLFQKFKLEPFKINKIWNELLSSRKLNGFESKNKFFHVTNLEVFKKLQDL